MPVGDDIKEILRTALPALASVYAAKKGNLKAFAEPFAQGELYRQERTDKLDYAQQQREDRQAEQDVLHEDRQRGYDLEQQRNDLGQRDTMETALYRATQQQAARDAEIADTLKSALDSASKNPSFMDLVNKQGAEAFSLQVPGMGNINLKQAFDKLGIIKGPDGYAYGAGPVIKEPDLVPTGGPGGPTYQPKVQGAPVYERPRQGPAPEKPAKPSYKRTIGANGSGTTYAVSDGQGLSVELSEDDLTALGIPASALPDILKDPPALAALLRAK